MKKMKLQDKYLRLITLLLLLSISIVWSSSGFGEVPPSKPTIKFPTKPLEMTVLFGAGSAADLMARKVAEIMGKELKQPIAVVNRTGAGGAVGYTYVKGQKADGYSVVWNSNSINTVYHIGNTKFNYTAFNGVAEIVTEPVSLTVKADAPWKDLNEFIEYARKNPGTIRIGNSGKGSFTHLTAVALENKAGVKFTHVPYGQVLAVTGVLGGHIESSVQLPAETMSLVKAGEVRILAITGDKRLKILPKVTTFKEKGIPLALSLWRGIAVPAGTSKPVISILESAVKKVSENTEFKNFAEKMGANIEFRDAKDFDQFIAQQDKELETLMEQIGMKKQ